MTPPPQSCWPILRAQNDFSFILLRDIGGDTRLLSSPCLSSHHFFKVYISFNSCSFTWLMIRKHKLVNRYPFLSFFFLSPFFSRFSFSLSFSLHISLKHRFHLNSSLRLEPPPLLLQIGHHCPSTDISTSPKMELILFSSKAAPPQGSQFL